MCGIEKCSLTEYKVNNENNLMKIAYGGRWRDSKSMQAILKMRLIYYFRV